MKDDGFKSKINVVSGFVGVLKKIYLGGLTLWHHLNYCIVTIQPLLSQKSIVSQIPLVCSAYTKTAKA